MWYFSTNLSRTSGISFELLIALDQRQGRRPAAAAEDRGVDPRARSGSGRLRGLGVALPPSRALAADLGVSRGVVVEAYEQLVAEGYLDDLLVAATPRWRRAAADPGRVPRPAAPPRPPRLLARRTARPQWTSATAALNVGRHFPMPPGCAPCGECSPRRLTSASATSMGASALELRVALAEYLNRVRGTLADPETLVITNGYAQAVSLLMGVCWPRAS